MSIDPAYSALPVLDGKADTVVGISSVPLFSMTPLLATPAVPLFRIATDNESCGENVGSFSYLFSFSSNTSPLAHMNMTRVGSSEVSAKDFLSVCEYSDKDRSLVFEDMLNRRTYEM